MGDNKTSHSHNDNNNDYTPLKEVEKVIDNNNISRGGEVRGSNRGGGSNRGLGHFVHNRGRFPFMHRGRGQGYKATGPTYNDRGRYGYPRNERGGRAFVGGWRGFPGHKFYKPRMVNTGPWSAYRDRHHPHFDKQHSTRPIESKILMQTLPEFNPQIPPPSYYSYYDSHAEASNYYYNPQATYYNPQTGGSNIHESQVVAVMPQVEVLEAAMAGLGLTSSEGITRLSSGVQAEGEKYNNNDQREQILIQNDGFVKSSAGEEKANGVIEPQGNPGQGVGVGDGGPVHLSTGANPLSLLGQSVELDKHLVDSLTGVEMRPVAPFPPNYNFQYYFIPYGTPPPQSVIPVMVFPYLSVSHNAGDIEATEVRQENANGGQVQQNGLNSHENNFPNLKSLLPSYIGNMDLPWSPLLEPSPVEILPPTMNPWPPNTPMEVYQPTMNPQPSNTPVEIYQPTTNPWPHQVMMDPVCPELQSGDSFKIENSQNENKENRQ